MEELNKANERTKKIKKVRTEIFLGIILIVFIIYKFSLYNYFSFVAYKDAKLIIRDFERNYLYSEGVTNQKYKTIKNEILSSNYTTKEKLDELFQAAKTAANDNYTTFSYADILRGKFRYSTHKNLKFESKQIGKDTVYVKLNTFGSKAAQKLYKVLDKMEDKDYLIIDLRDNNMGDYNEAVEIADMLLPGNSEICYIERMNSKHYYNSDSFMFDYKKVFVLLNEGSASSAEMLALTLKENLYDKVELIGKATAKKPIGQYYRSYDNKIDFDIATLRWFVKGKSAEGLEIYLSKYVNTDLKKIDDYLNQVNAQK